MQGFKSFARKTEIPFENAMNVIVGPNGSGKSNVTDALCFVLGRLSIKSIRAAKAANLLFSGNKSYKASQEAFVELVFDNSEKDFSIDSEEVSIKRLVRKNGQSVYKINGETKTRQELLELLAQAGIDPQGFNLVLQGEIASFVKMNADERRKIIEEVAGISVYEARKEKSLKELKKTEEKLKEVSAVLKERSVYLKNLDKERQDALNYKKLEERVKRCKATILSKKVDTKKKDVEKVNSSIAEKQSEISKVKNKIAEKQGEIDKIEKAIEEINKKIQSSTSNEQEVLHNEIAELKAEIAGLEVRKENFETRISDSEEKKENLVNKIKGLEKEISEMKSSSPELKKQQEELKKSQDRFDLLEKKRRRFYILKSDLNTLQSKKEQRQKSVEDNQKRLEMIEREIDLLVEGIKHVKSVEAGNKLEAETRNKILELNEKIANAERVNLELQKKNAILEQDVKREERLKEDITKIDICPVCKSDVTKEHIEEVVARANKKINAAEKEAKENKDKIEELKANSEKWNKDLEDLKIKIREIENDILKIKNAEEKKEQIKNINEQKAESGEEVNELSKKEKGLLKEFESLKNVEEDYEEARLKMSELSFADVDVDTEIALKQREFERIKIELKSLARDSEDSVESLKKINEDLDEKSKALDKKQEKEREVYEKFQKFFNERNILQDKEKAFETEIIGYEHSIRSHENEVNNLKIQKAQCDAQIDSLETEFREFENVETLSMSPEKAESKLKDAEFRISKLGSINMKALQTYEKVEEQCNLIQDKVDTIEKEKEKIYKIVEQIDKKKKKAFMQTLDAVNEYFTRNFMQLSKKGEVFLELENKKDPFEAGLNIILKVSRGKYFDVSSLSGGEKTLVALSLIFAIQEYRPYCFYVFDEIDAALDKHNSERLAGLIKKHMTSGQYIIVTHNDALISEASALYGISMQENISKVISLRV